MLVNEMEIFIPNTEFMLRIVALQSTNFIVPFLNGLKPLLLRFVFKIFFCIGNLYQVMKT